MEIKTSSIRIVFESGNLINLTIEEYEELREFFQKSLCPSVPLFIPYTTEPYSPIRFPIIACGSTDAERK